MLSRGMKMLKSNLFEAFNQRPERFDKCKQWREAGLDQDGFLLKYIDDIKRCLYSEAPTGQYCPVIDTEEGTEKEAENECDTGEEREKERAIGGGLDEENEEERAMMRDTEEGKEEEKAKGQAFAQK